MKIRILAAIALAAAAQASFATDEGYWTNVDTSFARMLHQQDRSAQYWANVEASFANMLNHVPYAGPTQVRVALGAKDPVEERLHAMLRPEAPQAEKLAGAAQARTE